MLRRRVSSSSLKAAAGTIKSLGSASGSPSLPRGLSSLNLHNQGLALASPPHSPHSLDFHSAAPHSPTIPKPWLEHCTHGPFSRTSFPIDPTSPDPSRTTQEQSKQSTKRLARLVQFELPPAVIEGLPVQQGLPGFASFNFGSVHSVTYRSTCERLPTPYPAREDLDWLELQDEAELFALSFQEDPGTCSDSSTPGTSTNPSPSLLLSGFPTALCLSKGDAMPLAKRSHSTRSQQGSLPHSKSLNALETLANDFITVTTSSLPTSRPSARPMLLSALSSALARRERSRRVRFEALPFAIHLNDGPSWEPSQHYVPTPFPSPCAGRVLDPDLMFGSAS